MIAFAGAGGLGLPDRDYYTKTDAKSEEIRREICGARGRKCSGCWATQRRTRTGKRRPLWVSKRRWPRASLTRVEQRDPYQVVPQDGSRPVAGSDAGFQLDALPDRQRPGRMERIQRDRAGLLQGSADPAGRHAAGGLESLPALAPGARARGVSFRAVRGGQFRFLRQVSARHAGTAAALEALRAIRG